MAGSADMIVPMLRDVRSEMNAGFDRVARPLQELEEAQVSFRQALGADSLLSKLVTGHFEARIEALETKVKELETSK